MLRRRQFVGTLSRGSTAVFILGITACATDERTSAPSTTTTASGTDPASTPATSSTTAPETAVPFAADPGAWARVDLGFVSAYVVVRSGEAAVIDTGTGGSEAAIQQVLAAEGSAWADVSHVFLTHSHGDHVGSLDAVMRSAANATAFAGAPDIGAMSSPREIVPVDDGEVRFGLEVVATPGHTPGHIALLDAALGVLFAGDALTGADGDAAGPNPDFTPDMATAEDSVRRIAALQFEHVVFGHGEPVIGGASARVSELAAGLSS